MKLRGINESKVRWLINKTAFPELTGLTVTEGTGGSAIFTTNILGAPGQSLLGYPIIYTDLCPVVGDAKDIVLADFADYVIADDTQGADIAQSIHLKFDYGQNTYRITKFIDGQNIRQKAFTPHKAGATAVTDRSTVVKLAERA